MDDKQKVVERLEGTKKHLWCPKCRCYPDKILEKNILIESRKWNEEMECYELDDEGRHEDECVWSKCLDCETELEDK